MRHMAFDQRNAFHKNNEGILLHRQGILLYSSDTYRYTFNFYALICLAWKQ